MFNVPKKNYKQYIRFLQTLILSVKTLCKVFMDGISYFTNGTQCFYGRYYLFYERYLRLLRTLIASVKTLCKGFTDAITSFTNGM